MSEEEKKAIEDLKEEINRPVEVREYKFDTFILYNIENAKIILNLVEKQQAELDSYNNLKQIEQEHQKINGELREEIKQLKEEYNIKILDNAGIYQLGFKDGQLNIKNKIKQKIKEMKKYAKLANDCIEEKIIIADSDSLNYGRKEAHNKDIEVLEGLLKE